MIIYPSLPSGHTIFCDDIRHEVTGKVTFVGSYGSHLYTTSFPATLPRLCCAVTYRESPTIGGAVAVRVIHDTDGEESVVADIKYEIPPELVRENETTEPFVMREMKFAIELSPFQVSGPGQLKVRAFRDDDEIRLGAIIIDLNPNTTPDEDATNS